MSLGIIKAIDPKANLMLLLDPKANLMLIQKQTSSILMLLLFCDKLRFRVSFIFA